jgi:hypothetical protein
LESLTAISGDMPRFPFTSSESVLRVTPKSGGGVRDRQARWLDALAQNNASGVRWVFHLAFEAM